MSDRIEKQVAQWLMVGTIVLCPDAPSTTSDRLKRQVDQLPGGTVDDQVDSEFPSIKPNFEHVQF